ncbi:MAG: LysE family transporter [Bacteroidetes bacterium]|nr:LysE family transporter [Bacteroidota bacterium]
MHLLFILFLGWLVSFLGQLPLGTMSMTATQIAVQENFAHAWKYAIGVALIEIIYLRLTLSGVNWILSHELFFLILGWLTVIMFLVLGIYSLISARKQDPGKKAFLLENKMDRFLLGLSMSAFNPAQIPFWFIWSSYLMELHILAKTTEEFNFFTVGCGAGTITGLALYMYGGNWLITKMNVSTRKMNVLMGIIFIIASLAQLYRMIFTKVVI